MNKIIIGSRGSKLAMIQAEEVKAALLTAYPEIAIEIRAMKSSGDLFKEGSLAAIGGKGLFTKEIDEALLAGAVDVAVHSLKDVPGEIPGEIRIAAILPREDARDALVSAAGTGLSGLPEGAVLGTSSPRRKAQALKIRPDLRVEIIRGNVPSRIEKVRNGEVGATVLARAGLKRLGLEEGSVMEMSEMLPAIGQGAIAVACRKDNEEASRLLSAINHKESFETTMIERELLKAFGGSCFTPLAAFCSAEKDLFRLTALIANPEGTDSATLTREASGFLPALEMGRSMGCELLKKYREM